MELPANISPTIALVGILAGIFLFSLSMLLFHFLLQRRRANKPGSVHHQRASFSPRRRSSSYSDSDLASEDADEEKTEGDGEKSTSSRASSLNLEPNQPFYVNVDVESESERGPHTGLQFILTPPTPGR